MEIELGKVLSHAHFVYNQSGPMIVQAHIRYSLTRQFTHMFISRSPNTDEPDMETSQSNNGDKY